MESDFGHDFAAVRVHADTDASAAAQIPDQDLENEINRIAAWLERDGASGPESAQALDRLACLEREAGRRATTAGRQARQERRRSAAKADFDRQIALGSRRTPGLFGSLMPNVARHYMRDTGDEIAHPVLRQQARVQTQASLAGAALTRDSIAAATGAMHVAYGAGILAFGAAAVMSSPTVITVVGNELAIARGALQPVVAAARTFTLICPIFVTEVGALGAGLMISCEFDPVRLAAALKNPLNWAQLLNTWVMHGRVSTNGGELKDVTLTAVPLPPAQQTQPGRLLLRLTGNGEVAVVAHPPAKAAAPGADTRPFALRVAQGPAMRPWSQPTARPVPVTKADIAKNVRVITLAETAEKTGPPGSQRDIGRSAELTQPSSEGPPTWAPKGPAIIVGTRQDFESMDAAAVLGETTGLPTYVGMRTMSRLSSPWRFERIDLSMTEEITLVGHGLVGSSGRANRILWESGKITPAELAGELIHADWRGGTIRLLVCRSGVSTPDGSSFARELTRELAAAGRPTIVIAPKASVLIADKPGGLPRVASGLDEDAPPLPSGMGPRFGWDYIFD